MYELKFKDLSEEEQMIIATEAVDIYKLPMEKVLELLEAGWKPEVNDDEYL